MRGRKSAVIGTLALIFCLAALLADRAGAATGKDIAGTADKLDNATCQNCHDGRKGRLEAPAAEGEKRELLPVRSDAYAKSVHSRMECVACHREITDSVSPHRRSDTAKPSCAQCHDALWETVKKEKLTQEKSRLGLVAQNIEAYKKSYHARPNKEDKTRVNATCDECHNSHSFSIAPAGTTQRTEWRLTIPAVCGEKCHTDELEEFNESVHGKQVREKGNLKSAVCSDCHSTHAIGNTSASPIKLTITASCGSCHEESLRTYRATYHGQVTALGYANTAKCYDCHGSHGITEAKDKASKVHPENRLKTCRQCHNEKKGLEEATPGMVTFSPHGNARDFEHYPQLWITSKFMILLLAGVFAFFWAHSLMWWFREYLDRRARRSRPHVREEEALQGVADGGRQVRRFGLAWRIGHLVFALSVMLLILTGMTVFYAEAAWAPTVMKLLGGPKIAGIIHRTSAAIMLGIFFVHLIAVAAILWRRRASFRWFGPDSLVPNWKDLWDIIGMFKWFLGLGPKPVFDRWTYWEKFDYWAVFWGMAIIGGSGMMLAFPNVTVSLLPGWVLNVATLVHGEEAFLAAVFLFTVHFFNNHFRPEKLPPPDVVMFTGTVALEEFRREHRAQYDRLVAAGELEQYIVDAPSPPMTLGSKILGLVLIAIGLALLVLVAIGFFSGAGAV